MANLTDAISDRVTIQTINLLRLAEGLTLPILRDLRELEKELLADLEDTVGKTDFTITRLKALLRQTQDTIKTAYNAIAVANEQGLTEVVGIAGRMTASAINASVGASVVSVAWSAAQLSEIATGTLIDGRVIRDWWEKQDAVLRDRFAAEMRVGQLRGETIDQLARRIRGTKEMGFKDGVMDASRAQARTLVRTAALSVSNAARMEVYAKNDELIKGVQWVATLDPRTCPICIPLDGLQWNFPPDEGGGGDYADYTTVGHDKEFEPPPLHFNCRCVVVPVTFSWEELAGSHGNSAAARLADKVPSGTRASMDGQVADTMTFSDWLETKDKEFQNDVLGPARADLWRAGNLELSGLTDQSNQPLTLEQIGG
jgi:SPP1 gp7 family putative phage head morphogenesis protein